MFGHPWHKSWKETTQVIATSACLMKCDRSWNSISQNLLRSYSRLSFQTPIVSLRRESCQTPVIKGSKQWAFRVSKTSILVHTLHNSASAMSLSTEAKPV